MSVQSYKRTESKGEYLYQIYELSKRVGQMTVNLPKKYMNSYGGQIINASLEALTSAQEINRIYINALNYEEVYLKRVNLCNIILARIDFLSSVINLYFDICKNSVEVKSSKKGKLDKWKLEVGSRCFNITNLINGLKKSDRERYNKFREKVQVEEKVDSNITTTTTANATEESIQA